MPRSTFPFPTKEGISDAGRKTLEAMPLNIRRFSVQKVTYRAIGWLRTRHTSSRLCLRNCMSAPTLHSLEPCVNFSDKKEANLLITPNIFRVAALPWCVSTIYGSTCATYLSLGLRIVNGHQGPLGGLNSFMSALRSDINEEKVHTHSGWWLDAKRANAVKSEIFYCSSWLVYLLTPMTSLRFT